MRTLARTWAATALGFGGFGAVAWTSAGHPAAIGGTAARSMAYGAMGYVER
jgi:hypothetical protein